MSSCSQRLSLMLEPANPQMRIAPGAQLVPAEQLRDWLAYAGSTPGEDNRRAFCQAPDRARLARCVARHRTAAKPVLAGAAKGRGIKACAKAVAGCVGGLVTAIGATWKAVLSTNERGRVLTRSARTRSLAFAIARTLLDQAEHRDDWNRGEVVSVEVRQADE